MNFSIGCNIVDPNCDKSEHYTKDVYIRQIHKYADYGIKFVEFSHVTMLSEDDAKQIKDFSLKEGVIPWSIHSEHLNGSNKEAIEEYFTIQEECAKIAKALGTYIFVCHLPNLDPRANDLVRDINLLTRLADITGKYNLKLAIETPPYEYILKIVEAIDRDDVGINLDTGHTFLEGKDPAEVAMAIGKRLFTLHLQDNFGINDDHQAPGMGNIDWTSMIKALKSINYTAPLIMELTGSEVKARRSDKFLKDFALEKEILFAKSYLKYLWRQA